MAFDYVDALRRAFGDEKPSLFRSYPLFGGIISPSDHFLIEGSEELVKRLLVVIGLEFPSIDYCPCIPDLSKCANLSYPSLYRPLSCRVFPFKHKKAYDHLQFKFC